MKFVLVRSTESLPRAKGSEAISNVFKQNVAHRDGLIRAPELVSGGSYVAQTVSSLSPRNGKEISD